MLTTKGSLPSGCDQVFRDLYVVDIMNDTNPEVTNEKKIIITVNKY